MPHHFGAVYRELFLPPVNRAMRLLDRSFFQKRIELTAANVFEIKNISRVKKECAHDVLDAPRIKPVLTIPWGHARERTLLLLKPDVKVNDFSTHSNKVKWFLWEEWMRLIPHNLDLTYDHWTYDEILAAVLPERLGSPVRSYQPVGHIGNLLIKPEFHPYRHIIAQVLLDKTPQLKSIVFKPLPEPGADPSLPRPPMEHLAGEPNTIITLQDAHCRLTLDYATNDYSQDLIHVHKTLLASFGESKHIAIAEVDAGVGQLTFPAIKSHILVHANNPSLANHTALISNIPATTPTACEPRPAAFVYATNLPVREFIPAAIRNLLARSLDQETNQVLWPLPFVNPKKLPPSPRVYKFPPVFSHFIIPHQAGGMTLLDAFHGSYAGLGIDERLMPMVHVYAYHSSRLPQIARKDFIDEVRVGLKFPIDEEEVSVECVIIGGKQKSMHRVSFRLPRKIAMTPVRGKVKWRKVMGEIGGGRQVLRNSRKR